MKSLKLYNGKDYYDNRCLEVDPKSGWKCPSCEHWWAEVIDREDPHCLECAEPPFRAWVKKTRKEAGLR